MTNVCGNETQGRFKNNREKRNIIPPVSPYGLIQETLWPNEWKILVACMLLNCTTRKSMEKVVKPLFEKYPDALSMTTANPNEVAELIGSLGFRNKRSKSLIEMSKAYVKKEWSHVCELPGIGEYASAAWEIFILGVLPPEPPKDHALTAYYMWRKKHGG